MSVEPPIPLPSTVTPTDGPVGDSFGEPPRAVRRRRVVSDRVWWLAVALLLAWGVRLALLSLSPDPHYTTAARAILLLPLLALWPAAARRVASRARCAASGGSPGPPGRLSPSRSGRGG